MNPAPLDPPSPPHPSDPLPAIDGLERLERIGSGSSGVVYKAYQASLKRYVALKVLRAPEFASAEEFRRFRREAELLAGSSHPHIVPVYSWGEVEVGPGVRCPYFSMPLMELGSLAEPSGWLADDPRAAAEVVAVVAGAVQHAHERGVLHRDLKPANILLDAEGRPHVADFGLARRGDGGTGGTPSGAVIGTPAYMAPEQARGDTELTPTADVYGLGAILYELLTGRPPFRGDSPAEVLRQVLREPPVRPRAFNRKVDRALEAVCLMCLEKDPARRYPSAARLAGELGHWLGGRPVSARPPLPWERLARGVRRRLAVAALAVVVLALAAVGIAAALRPAQDKAWAAYVEGLRVAEQRLGQGDTAGAEQALGTCPWSQRGWEWDCLKNLCKEARVARRPYFGASAKDIGTLKFDSKIPTNMVLTSPASHYAVAAWDMMVGRGNGQQELGRIEVWDTDSGRKVYELECNPHARRIVLSPDGRRFAMYLSPIWEVHDSATGAVIARLEDDSDRGWDRCCAFSPDGGLFASVGNELTVWDAGTGERLYARSRGRGFSPFLCFTPDGSRLVTSGPGSGEIVPQLPPDSTSTDEGRTEILEVRVARTGQELVRFSFSTQGVRGVSVISADGSRLVVPWTGDSVFSPNGSLLFFPFAQDRQERGSEFVFTEPILPTRLAVLLAAGAAVVAALFWLVRRLRASRRSARTRPPRPENWAASTTST